MSRPRDKRTARRYVAVTSACLVLSGTTASQSAKVTDPPVFHATATMLILSAPFVSGGLAQQMSAVDVPKQTTPTGASGRDQKSKPVRVVSIRFASVAGFCEGYCHTEMEVSPEEATLLKTSSRDEQRRYPNLRLRADISTKRWKELQQLVDRDAIFALPDRIGCGVCVDGVDYTAVEVRFTDHTRKSVTFADLASPPNQLKDLVDRLEALWEKLNKEFPPERPMT